MVSFRKNCLRETHQLNSVSKLDRGGLFRKWYSHTLRRLTERLKAAFFSSDVYAQGDFLAS